jgi:acetate kinase
MSPAILTLNAGSSSVKFALFQVNAGGLELRVKGQVEGLMRAPHFTVKDAQGTLLAQSYWEAAGGTHTGHSLAFEHIWRWLQTQGDSEAILAVGHRIVHGGPEFTQPVIIDDQVLAKLEALVPLMPLHQPHNLAAVRAVARRRSQLPQVACFDTAFHSQRRSVTERFGLPHALFESGVRRYGFHGLSYAYIARQLHKVAPAVATGRVVVAHLGSGCSMCALHAGKSVETTMSFSALDGLPMGTRCGNLDPGVLLYLMREQGMGVEQLEDLLYKRSGLLGISGVSNDLRDLLPSEAPLAREAVDYFIYRIGQTLGALVASLGGLDALVLTAGVGENSVEIRARICRDAAWLGIALDEPANQAGATRISVAGSRPSVWVIPTNEERMIATYTYELIEAHRAASA